MKKKSKVDSTEIVIAKKTMKLDTKKLSALEFWLLVKKNCVKGNHGCCFIACSVCYAQGDEFLCKMCGDTRKCTVKECLAFAENQIKILKGDNKKIVEEPNLKANEKLKGVLDTGKMSVGIDLASGESKTIIQEKPEPVITFGKMTEIETARAVVKVGGKCFTYETTFCHQCFNKEKCGVTHILTDEERVIAAEAYLKASEPVKEVFVKETQETYERKAVCIDKGYSSTLVVGRVYDVVKLSGDWISVAYENVRVGKYSTSLFDLLPITTLEKKGVVTGHDIKESMVVKEVCCILESSICRITVGKLYTVTDEDNIHYKIINDDRGLSWVPKYRFTDNASAQNKAYYTDNGKQYEITGETDFVYITKNDKGEVRHFRKDPMPQPVKINKPDTVYAVNGEYIKICHTKGRGVSLDSEGFLLVTTVDGQCRAYATPEEALQVAKKQWGVK